MRVLLGVSLCLLALSARADLSPEKLSAFKLDGSPFVKGFVEAKDSSRTVMRPKSHPSGAEAMLSASWFHGGTGLHTTVIKFENENALRTYKDMTPKMRQLATGFSPANAIRPRVVSWKPTKADEIEQRRRRTKDIDAQRKLSEELAARHPRTVYAGTIVGTYLIEVWVFEHQELDRRPHSAHFPSLPEQALVPLAKSVARELAKRAEAQVRSPGR